MNYSGPLSGNAQQLKKENEMSKNVQEKNETNVIPFDVSDMEADSGMGLGQVKQEDLALPFLKIADGKGDVKSGDIFNNVTGEIYSGSEGIRVVPCYYQKRYLEWAPRGSKGAPVNIFSPEDKAAGRIPATERRLKPDGTEDYTDWVVAQGPDDERGLNYIEDTAQHYVLILTPEGGMEPGLITMHKTGLKRSKAWNSMMRSRIVNGKNGPFMPPSFAFVYLLTSDKQHNSKDETWHLWKITLEGDISENCEDAGIVYNFAKSFASSIGAGEVTVKHESDVTPAKGDTAKGEDSPF